MPQYNVKVNIQTFGCLALGCERKEDAVELLKHMEVRNDVCTFVVTTVRP